MEVSERKRRRDGGSRNEIARTRFRIPKLEERGITREELYRQVETALIGAGYARVGEVFDGAVLGFAKGEDELAVKVDQVGEKLFLAVFDAQGIDPLLHGVVFGRYQVGETITGTEAAERLKKDLSD